MWSISRSTLGSPISKRSSTLPGSSASRCSGCRRAVQVAVEYAARHPERVSHLILYATYARGRLMRDPSPSAREQAELMISLIRMGWAQDQPAFRRLFTTLFIPDATSEQMEWFDELQRATTDAETAVRIRAARNHDEVTGAAGRVRSPTLVLHSRHDALVPFSGGPPARHADPAGTTRAAREPQPHPARGRARVGTVPRGAGRLPRPHRAGHRAFGCTRSATRELAGSTARPRTRLRPRAAVFGDACQFCFGSPSRNACLRCCRTVRRPPAHCRGPRPVET